MWDCCDRQKEAELQKGRVVREKARAVRDIQKATSSLNQLEAQLASKGSRSSRLVEEDESGKRKQDALTRFRRGACCFLTRTMKIDDGMEEIFTKEEQEVILKLMKRRPNDRDFGNSQGSRDVPRDEPEGHMTGRESLSVVEGFDPQDVTLDEILGDDFDDEH